MCFSNHWEIARAGGLCHDNFMKNCKRIAVIGSGAVGGYYGGLLQRAGCEVNFLLRSDYEHVREHGFQIDSVNGDFVLPNVRAWHNAYDMPPCDLVLVALKTTANHLLPDLLPPVIAPDGVVLTLQNGLAPEADVAACVGADKVMGGLCFICSNRIGPGHIRHLDYGLITLGEYRADGLPSGITARMEQVGALLEEAGNSIRLEPDLHLARWKKLVWNIPYNGLSVVHNCLTDVLMRQPETRALCRTLMEEVSAAAAACARPIAPDFIEKMLSDTEGMSPYEPSMKIDYKLGRPMELKAIYADPLCAARDAGVAMPETEKLYRQLCELNPAQ